MNMYDENDRSPHGDSGDGFEQRAGSAEGAGARARRGAHASVPIPGAGPAGRAAAASPDADAQSAGRHAVRTQGPDAMRHGMTGRHAAVHSRMVSPQAGVVSGNPRNQAQAQMRGRRLGGKTGKHSIDILGERATDFASSDARGAAPAPRSNNPRERAALAGATPASAAEAAPQSHNPRLLKNAQAAAAADAARPEAAPSGASDAQGTPRAARPGAGVQTLSGNPRAAKAQGGELPVYEGPVQPGAMQDGLDDYGVEDDAPAVGVIGGAASGAAVGAEPPISRFSPEINMAAAQQKRSKRRKIVAAIIAVLLVIVLGGGGAAFAYIMSIQSTLQEGVTEETLDVLDSSVPISDPFYMLLMGTDQSKQRDATGDFGDSYRTDSMMLLRIDPKDKKVACVSIMRDLQVELGSHGTQKINAAHAFGGTSLAIEAVSDLADVPIAHFAEIDFDGFKEVVDTLGGIEVDVPIEINDPDAGGHLNSGLQTLNGDQALILCRSRYAFEEYGSGDLYRAANQRIVIAAIVKKILSSDVPTMIETIGTLAEYVTTDLSVMDIVNLANTMRGMDMDNDFYTAVTPTESEYVGGVWWEILDDEAWETMMDRMFNGLPPVEETEIDEVTGMVFSNAGDGGAADAQIQRRKQNHHGKVSVKNGCGVTGVGAEVADIVAALGFETEAGNANNANYKETIVVYNDADREQDALDIATALGGVPIVKNDNEYIFSGDFLVVVGSDWVSD